MKVILTEKPSVARDIAKVLNIKNKKDGYLENEIYKITWAYGHMVELKEPNEYDDKLKKWSLESLPIIPTEFKLKAKKDKTTYKQLKIIKKLFEDAEEIICATDAGREGELIFRYITEWTNTEEKPFKRLWISSLTPESIKKGFNNLLDGNDLNPLYLAAKCRSQADWIVGMNGTRFFTLTHGGHNTLWSIGRVQTPLLAMIVKRDEEIANFEQSNFWEVHTIYRNALFKHESGKFEEERNAENILSKIKAQDLTIKEIQNKNEKIYPPLLYDLTDLQKDMNKRYSLTANDTLKTAQNLYEKKHITYPRTDSRFLTNDMKEAIPALLEKLRQGRENSIGKLNPSKLNFSKRNFNDGKVTDHHAIIPTDILPKNLSLNEQRLYDAILTRLVSIFYPPCLKAVSTVIADIKGEPFKAQGSSIIDLGWQALYPGKDKDKDKDKSDQQVLPAFEINESGPHEPNVKKMKTSPPKHFTEATLLNMMETAGKLVDKECLKKALKDKGLGTPATRASIIETLIHRKYIIRKKKNILSTKSGQYLISLIVDERLKSPELTGLWESNLKLIEDQKYDPEIFMQDCIEHTKKIIGSRQIPNISNKSKCPLCKADMIEGKKGFGCSKWQDGCPFVLWKNQFGASIDNFLAKEILHFKETQQNLLLNIDGSKFWGKIKLKSTGELFYEKDMTPLSFEKTESIGKCPSCGGEITETEKAYSCSNWRKGCKFAVWKKIAGKKISKKIAITLINEEKTETLKGFVSKKGKSFDARLKVIGSKVTFLFD